LLFKVNFISKLILVSRKWSRMVTITHIKIPIHWETNELIFCFWSVNVTKPRTFSTVCCKALLRYRLNVLRHLTFLTIHHFLPFLCILRRSSDKNRLKRLETVMRRLKMVKNVHDPKSKVQMYLSYLNFEKDRKIIILQTDWLFALERRMIINRTIKMMMMIEASAIFLFNNLCILFVILQSQKLNEWMAKWISWKFKTWFLPLSQWRDFFASFSIS